jgi:hypothetical protein
MMEMIGDLPSHDSIWDAEPPKDLACLGPIRDYPSRCVEDLVASFLDRKVLTDVTMRNSPLFHLQAAMLDGKSGRS